MEARSQSPRTQNARFSIDVARYLSAAFSAKTSSLCRFTKKLQTFHTTLRNVSSRNVYNETRSYETDRFLMLAIQTEAKLVQHT